MATKGFHPRKGTDIVISIYKESQTSLRSTLDLLQEIPLISNYSTIWNYTKDEKASLKQIKRTLKADHVIQLHNVSREGETYLHHITQQWDNLAEHTLFMQAEMHQQRVALHRNSGLRGYVTTCDCNGCGDFSGSRDDTNSIATIHAELDGGEKCKFALLLYRGQFIASARRIRVAKKEVFKKLHTALVDPKSWAHNEPYLRGRRDNMNNPRFGFTLERLWYTLMQCSDLDIAWRCPSLLSGLHVGARLEDCQCLDPVLDK
ncbi:hypothetical protein M501DRAFT_1007507 [Patellaria atrata CBS 101060]|uniref:Uncharacterized protein n=1 Tax=Patellaria atrata CBS 101060 TaxID=1346257 RepID=A0A9P4VK44_9PEZI|nr:hypothetical protein M501DRAFT_1007507 [Patellaria atrata CBS 101060]